MKTKLRSILISLVLLWTTITLAAPPLDQVSSLIEDDAFVVAHVDMQTFDFDLAMKTVASLYGNPPDMQGPQTKAREIIQSLKNNGTQSVFFALPYQDLGSSPYLLATVDNPQKNAEAVAAHLKQFAPHALVATPDATHKVVGNVVLFGPKKTLDRVSNPNAKLSATRIAKLKAAWAETENVGVQIALAPSNDIRRGISQMLPSTPDRPTILDIEDVLDGTKWAGLGIGTNGGPNLKLVVQANDDEAASDLLEYAKAYIDQGAKETMRRLSASRPGLDLLPELVKLRKMVTPNRQGAKLFTVISPEDMNAIQKVVTQPLNAKANRAQQINRLRMVAIAMLNFESAWRSYPPNASYDDNGKPLLSWRVFILPYIDEQGLYEQFHLDEPWYSEHNRTLIKKMPLVYKSRSKELPAGKTTMLVPVEKSTMFSGKEGTMIKHVLDGTSQTILVVDAAAEHAVEWTKPKDWEVDMASPFKGMLGDRTEFGVARCDGSAQIMSKAETSNEKLKALLTKNGGEVNSEIE